MPPAARLLALAAAAALVVPCASLEVLLYNSTGGNLTLVTTLVGRHTPASFGPVPGSEGYTVTGPLVVAEPEDACSPVAPVAAGSVVLLRRGDCSFSAKVEAAQAAGAAAVVVGNNEGSDARVRMGVGEGFDANDVTIPSVFVGRATYDDVLELDADVRAGREEGVDTMRLRIGEGGEGPAGGGGDIAQPPAYGSTYLWVMLAIPVIAMSTVGLLTLVRRAGVRNDASVRASASHSIPLVPYRAASTPSASTSPATSDAPGADEPAGDAEAAQPGAHNGECPVCITDFESGEMVKLLRCRHAFHAACVDRWFEEQSATCPVCRESIISNA